MNRYKESITKSTRGWKERLFARNSLTSEPNSGEADQRTANATISRMMDHLQIAEHGGTNRSAALHTSSPDRGESMSTSPSLNEDEAQPPTTSASN